MFPLPYAPPIGPVLYFLYGLELLLLAAGLALGKPNADRTCRLPTPLRMTLSAILVLAAAIGWLVGARGTSVEGFAALIFTGMAAGFAGDLIMARVIQTPNRLISGMAAFGIGHVLYLAGLLRLTSQTGKAPSVTIAALLVAVSAFCVWAWFTQVRRPGGSKAINAGSLIYGLLIGCVTTLAIALALRDAHYLGLALGALLFLCSDFVLGNWVIHGHVWPGVNDVIWSAYVSGQLLIVYSVAATINALH
jgi:hypothetical protein